jgi:hypothetical protein
MVRKKHDICHVVDWWDVLFKKDICPTGDKENEVETVEHEVKLAGIEVFETEDVIYGDGSSQAAPYSIQNGPSTKNNSSHGSERCSQMFLLK